MTMGLFPLRQIFFPSALNLKDIRGNSEITLKIFVSALNFET